MGKTQALEHEVERLRQVIQRRNAKIERLYAKLHDFKTNRESFQKLRKAVREQSEYIHALKTEIVRLGGDWRGLYNTEHRFKRRAARRAATTKSGELRTASSRLE